MKISLNQRIQYLSESFHKGELTLTDYRELRREEFEHLNSDAQKHPPSRDKHRESGASSVLAKKILIATLLSVALLLVTVILARWLF